MRNELEQIEKIHHYLSGQLPAAEKQAFEEQLANDPNLREEVRWQQEILKGIERTTFKKQIQKAATRFKLVRNFIKWGLTSLAVVLLAAAIFYYKDIITHGLSSYGGKALPEYNESGGKDWADADRNLAAQTFWVDASADTVIETKGGLVLSVPAAAFVDDKGQAVKGKIEVSIKEALDPATILRAGLSTKSGDRLLETGGMFFVGARKNGEILKIDPAHLIYAEVPADSIKPGMQLFGGKRMPDGSIDWTDPRPLEHGLTPIDILSLDFYPPHYLDSLSRWGYRSRDKKFTDSLYYSFARFFGKPGAEPAPEKANVEDTTGFQATYANNSRKKYSGSPQDTSRSIDLDVPKSDSSYDNAIHATCGINPAKIRTIWSREFQNTLLATREFEQRLALIHVCGNSQVLDLYVNNLGKRLSTIDSMAARLLTGNWKEQFLAFAGRQDGRVRDGLRQFDKLREYYQKKTAAVTQAITETQNEYWRKQQELDNTAGMMEQEHRFDSINRLNNNLREEFTLNLKEAYRQLGYDTTLATRARNRNIYQVPVANTGWWNVDKFVYESTVNRTSLDYKDTLTGKKAIIRYLPLSFQVAKSSEYDRLYVYLLPDKLSSFQRLEGVNGHYSEQLNELIKYKLVCIAYKGDQAYFYSQENAGSGAAGSGGAGSGGTGNGGAGNGGAGIQLAAIGGKELDAELNKAGNQTQAIRQEQSFFQFGIRDRERKRYNHELEQLTQRVLILIFPCALLEPAK